MTKIKDIFYAFIVISVFFIGPISIAIYLFDNNPVARWGIYLAVFVLIFSAPFTVWAIMDDIFKEKK